MSYLEKQIHQNQIMYNSINNLKILMNNEFDEFSKAKVDLKPLDIMVRGYKSKDSHQGKDGGIVSPRDKTNNNIRIITNANINNNKRLTNMNGRNIKSGDMSTKSLRKPYGEIDQGVSLRDLSKDLDRKGGDRNSTVPEAEAAERLEYIFSASKQINAQVRTFKIN